MRDKVAEKAVSKLVDELTALRKGQKLSHETLAQRTGLNRSAISLIESKKRTPTILTCFKIARALDVSLAALIRKIEASD
jgi:transcriptional regulator with XRE-family HTH domain